MTESLTRAVAALTPIEMGRRFERLCSRQVAGCRVRVVPGAGGRALELLAGPPTLRRSESVSIQGLDPESWSDPEGMESLATFVGAWIDAPEAERRSRPARSRASSFARRSLVPGQAEAPAAAGVAGGTVSTR